MNYVHVIVYSVMVDEFPCQSGGGGCQSLSKYLNLSVLQVSLN